MNSDLVLLPDEKVSVLTVMDIYRNRYEGTPLDVTLPGNEENRVIGTERSSQIHILQTFPDWPAECSSIDWLAGQHGALRVHSLLPGITDTAPAYHLDGDTYNPDGAFWKFKSICTIAEQNRSLYSQGVKDFWKLQEELMYQEMLDAAPAMLAKYSESRAAGDAYVTQLGIDMAEREMLLADNLYAKLLTTMMHNTGLSSSKTPTTFLSDVPLRQVAESRGYTVTWNKADGSTTIAKGDVTYTFTPESYECVTGTGETIELTHYCYVRDGSPISHGIPPKPCKQSQNTPPPATPGAVCFLIRLLRSKQHGLELAALQRRVDSGWDQGKVGHQGGGLPGGIVLRKGTK